MLTRSISNIKANNGPWLEVRASITITRTSVCIIFSVLSLPHLQMLCGTNCLCVSYSSSSTDPTLTRVSHTSELWRALRSVSKPVTFKNKTPRNR